MNKKYELTSETLEIDNHTLYRIKSLKDFSDVKSGDLGGWIESESNLSHEGSCWVYDNGCIFVNACICESAEISGRARVSGDAKMYENAWVGKKARISGTAILSGYTWICEDIKLESGIWNNTVKLGDNWYLVSTTLKKILVG